MKEVFLEGVKAEKRSKWKFRQHQLIKGCLMKTERTCQDESFRLQKETIETHASFSVKRKQALNTQAMRPKYQSVGSRLWMSSLICTFNKHPVKPHFAITVTSRKMLAFQMFILVASGSSFEKSC